jgi:hypothetical protein
MQECHPVPGEDQTLKQKVINMGSSLLAKFDPVNQICAHVSGFHFYSGEMNRQVPAHHYCSMLNQDFRQCVVYDSDKADARLIGVEYIISEKLFKTLPEEEKKYWHSHVYEVKGGLLTLPRIPYMTEKPVMQELLRTYGKTFHFWQIDRGDQLPLGEPKLMMAFTEDSQINQDLVMQRDKMYGVTREEIISNRMDLETPPILPGADAWKEGKATVIDVKQIDIEIPPKKKIA